MRIYSFILLTIFLIAITFVVIVSGCTTQTASKSDSKSITAFSFLSSLNSELSSDVVGTIDENTKTITISLPFGTPVSSLIATFQFTGTKVEVNSTEQISGTTVNDFTNSVVYKVIAEDGSSENYSITASAISGKTSITVFDGVCTDSIYLKWSSITGAQKYNIYQSDNSVDSFTLVDSTTDVGYRVTGLSPNTKKYYKIESVHNSTTESSDVTGATTRASLSAGVGGSANIQTHSGILYSYDPDANKKPLDELDVLTMNLHTYQETNQDAKFDLLVKTIAKLEIDLVAFVECAQNKSSSYIDGSTTIRTDNMAYIVVTRLKKYYNLDYYFKWDWAHYGWSVWEEGIAVVSKAPFSESESRWVSTEQSSGSIVSRKAIYGRTDLGVLGKIQFFSTHIHWRTSDTDTEQNSQINNVKSFVTDKITDNTPDINLSLVCGDFNMQPTDTAPYNEGYLTMTSGNEFIDTFLVYNPNANDLPEDSQYDTVKGAYPGRIDYIFIKNTTAYKVITSQIIFTPSIIGEISDHYGVITRLQKQ